MTANEELIDKCLASGWNITCWHGEFNALTPPSGDPRLFWCAQWEKVPYKDIVVFVPHWAAPDRYETPETK